MRPDFGCGVGRSLLAPESEATNAGIQCAVVADMSTRQQQVSSSPATSR